MNEPKKTNSDANGGSLSSLPSVEREALPSPIEGEPMETKDPVKLLIHPPPTLPEWGMRCGAEEAYLDFKRGRNTDILKSVKTILTPPHANPKLAKSSIPIYGITLAPAGMSGYQVCPSRSKACEASCLGVVSGRGRMSSTRASRIAKTKLLFEDPYRFFMKLYQEVDRACRKHGSWQLALRCNVLSDINWGGISPELSTFPIVRYDYTKMYRYLFYGHDIHYTFSYSGHNARLCYATLRRGVNVAVVVSEEVKKACLFKGSIDIFEGHYPVLDGDLSESRWLDPRGHIVLLRGKGKISHSNFYITRVEDLPVKI